MLWPPGTMNVWSTCSKFPGQELLNQGYARKMETWMQLLPLEWRTHSPRTCLDFAWIYLLRGKFKQSFSYLTQAQAILERLEAKCGNRRNAGGKPGSAGEFGTDAER